ncbi:hypothetical protein HY768_09960 [candidate division TA06 bacterium]|uniref:Uncharacterized protein n=1 Tax=candidate division TA06 bacterium TaxID=2250710 RepID=A0A933MKB0_UNCT6|nr:hypothetical protein [candidate division TA06 bacterium]
MALFGIWLAALLTLCIYSFLYKDNPLYKFAEHVYVGISAGYFVAAEFHNVVLPNLWIPLTTNFAHKYYLIIPGVMGLLVFFAFSRKYNWLLRFPISMVVGMGAGLSVTAFLSTDVLAQTQATLIPMNSLNNFLLVLGVLATLVYFFFSAEHKGFVGAGAKLGVWYLMIAFGAAFGYTVMARISLLIGRMQFLLGDWLHILK